MNDFLPKTGSIQVMRVGAEEIKAGALRSFDVVIFPGGSGSKESAAIDEPAAAGREVRPPGGGYLGICAGPIWAAPVSPGD